MPANTTTLLTSLTLAEQLKLHLESVLEDKERLKKNNFVFRAISLLRNIDQFLKEAKDLAGIDLEANRELSVGIFNVINQFANKSENLHLFLEIAKLLYDNECTEDDIFIVTNPAHKEYIKKLLNQNV